MVSATIDLGALRSNLEVLRRLAPKSRVMAVVKANAYGHGLVAVARALESADALAVARLSEALILREAGSKSPVVLLEGVLDRDQLIAAAAADLELVVHCEEQVELLKHSPAGTRFKIWLKLDSGMNRLGFKGGKFEAAHAALSALTCVQRPFNLCTHFASADSPESPTTAEQMTAFAAATRAFTGTRSLANSAALLGLPDSHADWVRPGLALYGISPFSGATGAQHGLQAVMALCARVIAVKHLAPGEQVGYGGGWTATRPTRLAIASVGYGDGYPRTAPAGTPVLVNGERASLAGRVSMDMLAVDVTESARPVKVGDPVVLWGDGLAVEEIARWAETIPYTLVCGISQRVAVSLRD